MHRMGFWLRWSGRDLRARWMQVVALALVIAIGVGTWAGLSGTARWRRVSNDRSLAALAVHDLRVELAEGSFVPQGALDAAVAPLVEVGTVVAAEERLVVLTQVETDGPDGPVWSPGRLVGVDVAAGAPIVDRFAVRAGSAPGVGSAVLDVHFADAHHLAPTGELRLAGGASVPYVGHVLTPENFIVVSDRGGFFAGSGFAVVHASLEVVQSVAGQTGQVNELVLRLTPGSDTDASAATVASLVADALPGVGVTVTAFADEPVYRFLYDDIDSDQRFYDIFAGLILAGAAVGSFNLARRLVEAQRRDMGIAMALGVPPRWIVVRPALVGVEIAVLGTLAGLGMGVLVSEAMRGLFEDFLPLPVWETSLDATAFTRAAAAGVLIPMLGLVWPVARAVRATPVETMAPPYRRAGGRQSVAGRHLRLGGSTLARMPLRNLTRSLGRTALVVVALASAVAVFAAVLGMLDSFRATISQAERAIESTAPERVAVDLEQVVPTSDPVVAAIATSPSVAAWDVGLRLPAAFVDETGGEQFSVMIELRDLTGGVWVPETRPALAPDVPLGVVLADKAAADLGVDVGDTVRLRHPRRTGLASATFVVSEVPVLARHDVPLRSVVLMDLAHADLMNLAGAVNTMDVVPVAGTPASAVERELFALEGVASVQAVGSTVEVYRDLLDDFLGFLVIVQLVTLAIVALVAFNATSISVDERRREHATMRAFGVPTSGIVRSLTVENAWLGLAGGLLGLGMGWVLLWWLMATSVPETVPDVSVSTTMTWSSVAWVVGSAFITVAATPLTTWRRLRRLDLPSTLRVVE